MDITTAFYIQIMLLVITFIILLRYMKANDRTEKKLEELEKKLDKMKGRGTE